MPRQLQSKIHSDYSTGEVIWSGYRDEIVSLATGAASGCQEDFNDHLIREFNRKIFLLNQPTGYLFTPYDAGYRLTDNLNVTTSLGTFTIYVGFA